METREYDGIAVREGVRRLKSHLRITADDLDGELEQKFLAAALFAEHWTGMTIVLSSVVLSSPFSRSVPLRPTVSAVRGVAVDGADLPAGSWTLSGGDVLLADSVSGSTVTVRYAAGLVTVPDDIMQAILLKAGSMFSSPLDSVEVLATASMNLLRPYRTYRNG